jgi:hypothetical protein
MVLPPARLPERSKPMAEQNGNKPEEVLDLDAFSPVPTRKLKLAGKYYDVISFFDIEAEGALKLLRSEEEASGKPINDQLSRLREQLKILVPTLPEEPLAKLSWRKLVAVTREAWLLARPLGAPISSPVAGQEIPGADPSVPVDGHIESAPSSPESPASTTSPTTG